MALDKTTLQYTPLEAIPVIVSELRNSFYEQTTLPIEWRKMQLRKLYWGIKDNETKIKEALQSDLRKSALETYTGEIAIALSDLLYVLEHLDEWAKDETMGREFIIGFSKPRVRKEPLGVVLIIGAFNYPVQLTLCPLIGAIAAGNTALIKPSENSPASALVITQIIEKYLDNNCFRVVHGAIDETAAILNQRFDKILFTGSGFVGRIVAQAAAKHLTPCILELGGINPAIVTKNADVELAAKRIAWARMYNAGQVCAAPGYVMVHPDVEEQLITGIANAWKEFFPNGAKNSPDFPRMNNARGFQRVKKMLADTQGRILVGGDTDETDNFIEPTLVKVDSPADAVLREESFGPVLALVTHENLDEAIATIRTICATPLALYIFTNDKQEQEKILRGTRSGSSVINDCLIHVGIKSLPFGGVGESGYGAYRGKQSFEAFVHKRGIVSQKSWMEKILTNRYPPYSAKKLQRIQSNARKPNFGRDGEVATSWLALILKLGSWSLSGAAARYAVLLLGKISPIK
ncbi:Aldehyde/histidinol dehydrogenase [Kalaharituber pfeilii]|nr:Aldehyde/histidinol dehydrogenase [Kalaharituber pfeilii]